jgi:hypothetical protein
MLLDPRWDKKQNAFTLESLIAWLETKNPREVYFYWNQCSCLNAQYFRAMGFDVKRMGACDFEADHMIYELPQTFDRIASCSRNFWSFNRTFGKALKLARKALKEEHACIY